MPKNRSALRRRLFLETYALLLAGVAGTAIIGIALAWGHHRAITEALLQREAATLSSIVEERIGVIRNTLFRIERTHGDPASVLPGLRAIAEIHEGGTIEPWYGEAIPQAVLRRAAREDTFIDVITQATEGWTTIVLAVPTRGRRGARVALFDAHDLQRSLLRARGEPALSITLAIARRNELLVLHGDGDDAVLIPAVLDAESNEQSRALWGAIGGDRRMIRAPDYAGLDSVSVFRPLPSFHAAVGVTMSTASMRAPIRILARQLALAGLAIATLLSLSTILLARRIIHPLEHIARKLRGLETRHWVYRGSITTGDELEEVDRAAVDLTERLRASHDHMESIVRDRTEALRRELVTNQAILCSVEYGIVMVDALGRVTYANPAAQALLHKVPEGTSIEDALTLLSNDGHRIPRDEHPARIVLATKTSYRPAVDPAFSISTSNGETRAVHILATPALRGSTLVGAVVVIRDTTEERRIDRIKSEFISLVSHQLRTPLTSMGWSLELLLSDDAGLRPDLREAAEDLSASSARMIRMVNGLLNVSRMEMGGLRVASEILNPCDIIHATLDTFNLELKKQEMTAEVDASCPEDVRVHTDRELLQLIVENLISNAIKYSAKGSKIRVAMTVDATKRAAVISVADDGIGIPSHQRAMIGKRLFRGSNATLASTDGNGLGLYISFIATDAIGGTLTFESEEGKGTIFSLRVPLSCGPAHEPS